MVGVLPHTDLSFEIQAISQGGQWVNLLNVKHRIGA